MTLLGELWAKDGVVDQARFMAEEVGAKPYRVFLCWARSKGGEVGEGREAGPWRYEVRPRPKVTGYAAIARNPTVIGVVPTGTVRLEEVPLWLPFEALQGHRHPERREAFDGPSEGVRFWYEIDVVEGADPSFKPQAFRLDGVPERDETNAQWLLMLARQSAQDR